MSGACSALATGWPGIAVPPGSAHSPQGEKQSNLKGHSKFLKSVALFIPSPWWAGGILIRIEKGKLPVISSFSCTLSILGLFGSYN